MNQTTPQWYQNTIIYEVHVRAFADGNGDGIGDFKGLISKLDYLERLGVGAVWLLPFYPSPLRDDGYDVADYTDVHPDYGTIADFKHFLREAHARGIKVITELVLNHTSDQHPWFQRACKAKPGSVYRDFYVWSDTQDKYPEVRIVFKDFEPSNWTWNAEAGAYFWHRFYSHQPDLNFDSPQVCRAMLKVVDFWMGLGVDGMRLDAVPYLLERPGTTCENLPETHAYLKTLRAHIDTSFPGRMLLAEANLWPEDAVDYFGQGDECHMAFHFPLMPRIFMSMWLEDRHPIVDIINQTPSIPDNCQWAVFLRNHDELTLEAIGDEERDYMYRAYARDRKARINLGIRRRLAPLMQKNRRKMELINFLLFSFPGTPIIYYGDEIGMGDNYYLGDRNGVRTPMQWTPDRNAGFSQANPQALFLPVIIDPEYHYELVNIESEERSPSSFLWWMRRLIAVYKAQPALGPGDLRFVSCENSRILTFLRTNNDDQLLVVVNLSRFAQVAELALEEFAGFTPVEVFGNSRFPTIGKKTYILTLGPHDYLWLRLEKAPQTRTAGPVLQRTILAYSNETGIIQQSNKAVLESRVLPNMLLGPGLSPANHLSELSIIDSLSLRSPSRETTLLLAENPLGPSRQSIYQLMASAVLDRRTDSDLEPVSEPFLAGLRGKETQGVLTDGFHDMKAVLSVLSLLRGPRKRHGSNGCFRTEVHSSKKLRSLLAGQTQLRPIRFTDHTGTYALGNEAFIKFFRLLTEGVNPEAEMLSILEAEQFPGTPRLIASLSYHPPQGDPMTLAVVTEYMSGAQDGETFTVDALERFFEAVLAGDLPAPPFKAAAPFAPSAPLTAEQTAMVDAYTLEFFYNLGKRIMELHTVTAGLKRPHPEPEPINRAYLRSVYQATRTQVHRVCLGVEQLRRTAARQGLPVPSPFPEKHFLERFARLLHIHPVGLRVRIHGNLRLSSVLRLGKDWLLVNFDGDARLPVGERVIKRSPLRDAASMLFSIGLTGEKALRTPPERTQADRDRLAPWLSFWRHSVCTEFLNGYREACVNTTLLPQEEDAFRELLEICLLEQILLVLERSLEEAPEDIPMLLNIARALLRFLS